MKVLVTGAGGNLARVVVPALAAAGHTLRLLDFRPIDTAHDLLQGDLPAKPACHLTRSFPSFRPLQGCCVCADA